ncbi:MAG: hypothetical protein AAF514_11375 [Verrucomicrobiota bacterium]
MKNPRTQFLPFGGPLLIAGIFFLSGRPALSQEAFPVDESWAYELTLREDAFPGFQGKLVQADKGAGLTATVARGNAHLRGALLDPATEEPFENLAVTTDGQPDGWEGMPLGADGSFVETGVINYSGDGSGIPLQDGNFSDFEGDSPDQPFPGVPGADDGDRTFFENGQNFSLELNTFLELPAGEILLGVRHDDAIEVSFHPNDARDIFRQRVIGFDSNSGKADRTGLISVPEEGLYSVRILLAQWTGDSTLEFYTASPDDPEVLTLVNGEGAGSIKAWQRLESNSRPWVSEVEPALNATGVELDSSIVVRLENAEGVPEVRVNGEVVEVQSEPAGEGEALLLTYQPAQPFEAASVVNVEMTYGSTTSRWSFVTKSGRKALLITGGGQLNSADGWVASRLATEFGFDVIVNGDGAVQVEDAEGVSLIYNSSTVNSGKVADDDFEALAIPIIDVEAGNVDDFHLSDLPINWGNGPGSGFDSVLITEESHPISAGIDPGEQVFSTNRIQYHYGSPPAEATVIGRSLNEEHATIYALEAGAEIFDEAGEVLFTHPARRVFFGMAGNDGAASFTSTGVRLFDAAVSWALSKPVTIDTVPVLKTIVVEESVSIEFEKLEAERIYRLQRAIDLQNWEEVEGAKLVDVDGSLLSFIVPKTGVRTEQFRISVSLPPALFAEDFEGDASDWEVATTQGESSWELGRPAVDGLDAARSGEKAYGTDLDAAYGNNVITSLTSPVIDLTGVRRAKLSFWYYVDATEDAEGAQLQFLSDDGQLLTTRADIFWGRTEGWTELSETLPAEAQGRPIRLRWVFLSDAGGPNGTGFYLDDVVVDD